MRILYITRANLCLRRAHSHNILATAALLGAIPGTSVELVSCGRQSCSIEEMLKRHDVDGKISFQKSVWLAGRILRNRKTFDVLYVRDPRLILEMTLARLLGKKVIFEIHGSREWSGLLWLWRFAHKIASAHIFITKNLEKEYSLSAKPRAVISCYGVDLERFSAKPALLREKFDIGESVFLALYLGSSERYYDIKILIDMLLYTPSDVVLLVAGLKDADKKKFMDYARARGLEERARFAGRIDYRDVPSYLRAADMLVNPKVRGFAGSISAKLYDYLAAGKAIVASTVPADLEVLSKENALFVEPTPHGFARAIKYLFETPSERERLAARALRDAQNYANVVRGAAFSVFLSKL